MPDLHSDAIIAAFAGAVLMTLSFGVYLYHQRINAQREANNMIERRQRDERVEFDRRQLTAQVEQLKAEVATVRAELAQLQEEYARLLSKHASLAQSFGMLSELLAKRDTNITPELLRVLGQAMENARPSPMQLNVGRDATIGGDVADSKRAGG